MRKIISLIFVCMMLSLSYGVLAADEIHSQTTGNGVTAYTLDVLSSETVIADEGGMRTVSVKVKNYGADTSWNATLIAAFKNKETGAVFDMDTYVLSIPASDEKTLSATVTIPSESVIDDYEFKYYVWDNFVNMVSIGNTAPTTPTNFKVEEVTNSTVKLTWDAAKDDAGTITYLVYRGDNKIAETTATTFTDTGRDDGTEYTYCVQAKDGAGATSDKTEAVEATTLKVLKMSMSELKDFLNTTNVQNDWTVLSNGTTRLTTKITTGGLGVYEVDTSSASTFTDVYDKEFYEAKKLNNEAELAQGDYGFCDMTDSDGDERLCLTTQDLTGDKFYITMSDTDVRSSAKKTFKITVLDNAVKTINVRYVPTTGSRKDFTFNLENTGKWVTRYLVIEDTYNGDIAQKGYVFEFGKGSYGTDFSGTTYISDIEVICGTYVPKEATE